MTDDTDLVYVSSYTHDDGEGDGITAVHRDKRTGDLSIIDAVAKVPSASFLRRHPGRPVLYAVSERPEGRLYGWRVASDGGLDPLGDVATGGAGPCHLAVHNSGAYVLSANYVGGSVAVNRIDEHGVPGELSHLVTHEGQGPHDERQEAPHPHQIAIDPDGYYVHVIDLGADGIFHYRFDTNTGQLIASTPTRTPPGTGPRHVAGHGTLRYLVGELDNSITSYLVNPFDHSWLIQDRAQVTSEPEGLPSEVGISSDGRFVYVASRGPDVISVFATDGGGLRRIAEVPCGGQWPRHFALVDEHLYVANQNSHSVVTFRIDPSSGVPERTGNQLEIGSPSCVYCFFPARLI